MNTMREAQWDLSTTHADSQGNGTYLYDGPANLTALQYPQDNKTCYYAYDGAQRMTKAQSPAGFTAYWIYDPDSDVTKKVYGNGMISWATFDAVDRMTSLRYTTNTGAPIAYFDYSRDVSGRINIINREPALGVAIYYSYDNIDRLLAEVWRKQSDNSQVYAFSYSYDTAHNRLTMRREGSTVGTDFESAYYAYANDNSMTKKRVYTAPSTFVNTYFYYDNNGARTAAVEGGSPTYFGYGANKLPTVIAPPGIAATYFYYDALLNRYCINNAGMPTYYLWEGLKLLEERDASGNLLARFTHGYSRLSSIGTLVEMQRNVGGATYYQFPLMDHRGTVYATSDGANVALQQSYTLDSFGRPLAAVGGAFPAIPNEFISQTNAMTLQIGGVWYLLFKYRIIRIDEGSFLSRDFLPYLNKYRAWSNNPVGQVDNNGLESADSGSGTLQTFDDLVKIAEYTKSITNKVGKCNANDARLLFLKTQQAILDKLSKKKCCTGSAKSTDWIVRVVSRFMASLNNALQGKFAHGSSALKDRVNKTGGNEEWAATFAAISNIQKERPDVASVYAAVTMMEIHIGVDLKDALTIEGVGTDADYECIGQAVKEAMLENFPFSATPDQASCISDLGAQFYGNKFDPLKLRDEVRNDVKKFLLETYGISDPYAGYNPLNPPPTIPSPPALPLPPPVPGNLDQAFGKGIR